MDTGQPEAESYRLLVVDDSYKNIELLKKVLADRKYELEFAFDGQEALEKAFSRIYDLILLDIMMPEMDGYEVCKRLKKSPKAKDIPVIFLTSRTSTDDIVKGFEYGAADYVTIPFNASELLVRVKTHLNLKRAMDEVKTLRGILPICASCKKIRDDKGYWKQVEEYIENNTEIEFSHGLCPGCLETLYPEFSD
ncbi:MAG: response regulator [bacterium]|nr:response regulator [bacterium]